MPHPSTVPDEELLKNCTIEFGRGSGPGGQHRNKVETAVTLTHKPTQLKAHAAERRAQRDNRRMALRRLRLGLARKVRYRINPRTFQPSELWESRRQGNKLPINPSHRDYPALLSEALDVITTLNYDVAGAAGLLRITMSQLARLVRHDRKAFAMVNEERKKRGLPALK